MFSTDMNELTDCPEPENISSLVIVVHEVRGSCPVHKAGDRIVIQGGEIDMDITDKLCTHALSVLLHYSTALEHGVSSVKLGLSKDGENAYLQCVDPGCPYTDGGTVIFRCRLRSEI